MQPNLKCLASTCAVATLDMRTSDICAALDGKQFDVDKGVPGTNMPPMHAWCRSTTIAVIDGAVTEGLKRRARDPETGETYEVPADMTYGEWRDSLRESKRGLTPSGKIEWMPRGKQITALQYKELRAYAESYGINIQGFRKSDVDIELAKEFISDTAKMLDKYPELRENGVFTIALKSMNADDFAITKRGIYNRLWLNKAMMRSKGKLESEYAKLAADGWFVKGTNYHSVIYHEFGHLLEDKYDIDSLRLLKGVLGVDCDGEVFDFCMENLSEYSIEYIDGREIISEMFSAFESGKQQDFVLTFMQKCSIL